MVDVLLESPLALDDLADGRGRGPGPERRSPDIWMPVFM
jgi:hypothetical protein